METHVQTHDTAVEVKQPAAAPFSKQTALLLPLLALLVVAVVVFTASLLLRGHGTDKTTPPVGTPAAVSESQLKALAAQSDQPIYWAGPKRGAYELTRTTDGRVYVRYLSSAVEVGDRTPSHLTIGTYPMKQAFTAIKRAATRAGGVSVKIENGGLLVFNDSTPKSAYFGYPNSRYQVEVYDPSPLQARKLVLGGSITPIR